MGYLFQASMNPPGASSSRGFSLVEILVAVGIMGGVVLIQVSLMSSMLNQNKALSQKLEAVQLEQILTRQMAGQASCDCLFSGTSWTPTNGAINISKLGGACSGGRAIAEATKPLSAGGTGLTVEAIRLTNLANIDATRKMADLEVSFNPSSMVIPLKPVKIVSQSFTLSGTTTKCSGIAGSDTICAGLGGQWTGTNCTLSAQATCDSLGGTWSGSDCKLTTITVAANQPAQSQSPATTTTTATSAIQTVQPAASLPVCIYQTIGTAAGVTCPASPDPNWCQPWGTYTGMTSNNNACTVFCMSKTPSNGPAGTNCRVQ